MVVGGGVILAISLAGIVFVMDRCRPMNEMPCSDDTLSCRHRSSLCEAQTSIHRAFLLHCCSIASALKQPTSRLDASLLPLPESWNDGPNPGFWAFLASYRNGLELPEPRGSPGSGR
jgi:hypothetical protein